MKNTLFRIITTVYDRYFLDTLEYIRHEDTLENARALAERYCEHHRCYSVVILRGTGGDCWETIAEYEGPANPCLRWSTFPREPKPCHT